MKILLALSLSFVFVFAVGRVGMPASLSSAMAEPADLPNSGCCSWHGGAFGCNGGRILCCDNTLSPPCRCN
jgi:hypothetical protein